MTSINAFCNTKSKNRSYVVRINNGGNFCGHKPDAPLLSVKCKPIKRPKVIKVAQKKLESFYSLPKTIPELEKARNSKRQQRSERREAEIQILKVILEYTDLVTLRCGIPTEDGFKPLTLSFLVGKTHLHQRRAERALSDLSNAGIITTHQPREFVNNRWIGFAGIRTISKKLFKLLGLSQWLKLDRIKATKALEQKVKIVGKNIIDFTKAIVRKRTYKKPYDIYTQEEIARIRTEILIHLKLQYPDKNAEEINQIADITLKLANKISK